MGKSCEICGRSIKSGWKYCWEHRNIANSYGNINTKTLDEGKEIYKSIRARQVDKKIAIILFFVFFSIFIYCTYFVIKMSWYSSILLSLFITFIFLAYVFRKPNNRAKAMAESEIYNQDQRFTGIAKQYIKQSRDQREYEKSLFE